MSIKETISKIKTFLEEDVVADVSENFTDVKTNDGIILSFEGELAEGVEIFIVDEAGRTPAPDGDYLVEDQKIMVVDGKVAGLETVVSEEIPVEETPEVEAKVEAEEETKDPMADLIAKVQKLESDQVEMLEVITKIAESISKQNFKEEVKMEVEKPTKIKMRKVVETTKNINPLVAFSKRK